MRQQDLLRRLQIRHSPSQLQNPIISPSQQAQFAHSSFKQVPHVIGQPVELLDLFALYVGVAMQFSPSEASLFNLTEGNYATSDLLGGFARAFWPRRTWLTVLI